LEGKKVRKKSLKSDKRASTYAVVIFFIAFFFFAFVWFILFSSDGIVTRTNSAMSTFVSTYETNNHALYGPVVAFTDAIQRYILIIGILGMFIAGIVYTQRKKAEGSI